MTNEAADILRKAKELVELGWAQKAFGYSESNLPLWSDELETAAKVCAEGALCRVTGLNAAQIERTPSYGFLKQVVAPDTGVIFTWNDEPGRTKEDVLSAFDRAIALAEAGK